MRTKMPSQRTQIRSLSGGNQQKVILARWLLTEPEVLFWTSPPVVSTWAQDRGLPGHERSVKAGKCVIMVSSELPEILAMSDHVVVMRGGRVMADIDRDTPHFNSEDIMKAAWGGELD